MKIKLLKKKEVWWPTRRGWVVLLAVFLGLPGWWWFRGEEFLSKTERVEADVLVVEGWIGAEGLLEAATEFQGGGYRYVIAAGLPPDRPDPTGEPWDYAEVAVKWLEKGGVDPGLIVKAPGKNAERHRTYQTALGVRGGLTDRRIAPRTLTIFTAGPHARRSQCVFEEVFSPGVDVGVIAWIPDRYEGIHWRRSSERSKNFVEETLGYAHELLLNGGRSKDEQ